MTENEERKFNAWESLRDHAWKEFEDKSRAEWRLSFGIWAALLATASALLASGQSTVASLRQHVLPCLNLFIALVIVLAHFGFLYWIQRKLQKAREVLSEANDEMRKLLGAPNKPIDDRSVWSQYPMYLECGITILLVTVLSLVFQYSVTMPK